MSKLEVRSFSREFKVAAVQRMEAGENVSGLSRELLVALWKYVNAGVVIQGAVFGDA